MEISAIKELLSKLSYKRPAGSEEEKNCALYIKEYLEALGLSPELKAFPIKAYEPICASLSVDGNCFAATPVFGSKRGSAEGLLYHLTCAENIENQPIENAIVLSDKPISRALYEKLLEKKVSGIILFSGDLLFGSEKPTERELRFPISEEAKLPIINIHIKDALEIIKKEGSIARISLDYKERTAYSHNLLLEIPGETEESIIFSAHYDSTPNSSGAYDNLSSAIALISIAEYFKDKKPLKTLKFLWCGAEERGLLGSLQYCKENKKDLKKARLNINLDMIGVYIGEFVGFSSADRRAEVFLKDFFKAEKISASVRYGIRSSDSNSFAFYGVPSVSFARYAPDSAARIHTEFDTSEVVSPKQLTEDIEIIKCFTECYLKTQETRFSISSKIRKEVDKYMERNNSSSKHE